MFTQNIEATKSTLLALKRSQSKETHQIPQTDLRGVVRQACEKVAPVWPLANFIAVNPLKGFETHSFNEAIEVAKKMFHAKALPDLTYFHQKYREGRIAPQDLLDALQKRNPTRSAQELMRVLIEEVYREQREANQPLEDVFLLLSEWSDQLRGTRLYSTMQAEITKWSAAYFDRGEAAWSMPGREQGFYLAWKGLAIYDKSIERAGISGFRDYVKRLPSDSFDAIKKIVRAMGIPEIHLQDYLIRHLAASPGWSGLFAFYGSEKEFQLGKDKYQPLVDLLAVRLAYDYLGVCEVIAKEGSKLSPWQTLVELANKNLENSPDKPSSKSTSGLVWLEAFEKNYRDKLLSKIGQVAETRIDFSPATNRRPKAQAIFCIDVRSEAFRRNLEHQGHYDTYGFAGFFAVPLAHQEFGEEVPASQCPVLIRPKYLITEEPINASKYEVARHLSSRKSEHLIESSLHEVKNTSVSPFALVETFGGLGFFSMYFRSLTPKLKKLTQKLFDFVGMKKLKTQPVLIAKNKPEGGLYQLGIPFEDQVTIAENSLRIMGLLSNFAKIVLLCGHGSDTTNNAYASALDCGACGGHRGAPNARVAAQIFNNVSVREELSRRGIIIPTDTVFVAGEHNTATDTITFFDETSVPVSHLGELASFKTALTETKEFLNWERTQRFDNPSQNSDEAAKEVERRSADWSEARPEWGLAGNAAFVVAKRSLTKSLDLGSRAFLHSYDWQSDTTGSALEVIMTAPMVVGEWINTQYYFSSVDNEVFGSGSKVIQNVIGKLGVMQGNVSDLKIGLPYQSVSNGIDLVHEPMRLLVVIEAPRERVEAIVTKHQSVKQLVLNEWIRLVVLEPTDKKFYRYSPDQKWDLEIVS